MEIFIGIRKGIQELISKKPDATAKEVLKGLELTQEILEVFNRNLLKEE